MRETVICFLDKNGLACNSAQATHVVVSREVAGFRKVVVHMPLLTSELEKAVKSIALLATDVAGSMKGARK